MNEHGTTPNPSSDHPEMVAQSSYFSVAHPSGNSADPGQTTGIQESGSVSQASARSRSMVENHPSSNPEAPLPLPQDPLVTRHTFNPNIRHSHSHSPFSFLSTSSGDTSKLLKIELSQPELVLKDGDITVMEGIVYVNLQKNIKVKTLQLEFVGRTTINWIDDNSYSSSSKHTSATHIEHSWPLIAHEHKQPPTPLQAGQHAFSFSLELPDTLPETLHTTHGSVQYKLSASFVKSGIRFHTHTTSAYVTIKRQHIQASRSYHQSARCSNNTNDEIKYTVTLPQTRVPHATKVPLQVSITAPTSRIQVQVLQVGLWEKIIYKSDGRRKVDMRLVKIQKSEGWGRPPNHEAEAWNWNKVLLFDMPRIGSDLNQCNPSVDSGLMKVVHLLRFSILGSDGSRRFRVENEIDIKVLAFEDDIAVDPNEDVFAHDSELPSYLTSFTTPRVSMDESERPTEHVEEDLLRNMLHRIHLPTYTESEVANSRGNSRSNSRSASRSQSRSISPERPNSTNEIPPSSISNNPYFSHLNCHQTNIHSPLSENTFFPSTPTAEYPYPMDIPNIARRPAAETNANSLANY
ncbi:hypothetical protein BGZ76_005130 [Entomortierella beljakovae]|nr:hypothetical protein BGZ76_005130 [Entomortierella beljakovae]